MRGLVIVMAVVVLSGCKSKSNATKAEGSAKPEGSAKAEGAATDTPARVRATAPMMKTFDELSWVDVAQRPGMRMAVLSGDPASTAYTQMRKVPAATDNPLHAHSSEIQNVIIRGVWYTGPDAASAKDFGPGSIVLMPADWQHVSGCRAGEDCVFYQSSDGKFDFKPVAAK